MTTHTISISSRIHYGIFQLKIQTKIQIHFVQMKYVESLNFSDVNSVEILNTLNLHPNYLSFFD